MDLQITGFLLFILFTAGQSLSCYKCTDSCTQTTCLSGFSNCIGLTIFQGDSKFVHKSCISSVGCPSGSVNVGYIKLSSYCCNTDLCNAQNASDPSTNTPNGNKCYTCDGQNCTKTMNCSGTEDRCITTSGNDQSLVFKGCASKSICDNPGINSTLSNFKCCEGNFCNGDTQRVTTVTQSVTQKSNGPQSVTQSFLFLCCSLISFIILH